jgi:alpha-galactosidase
MICNIANIGNYVPGVPSDFAVEIWTMVSKRGIQGIQSSGLPPMVLAYLQRDRVVPVNLELEAYDKGSRQLLLELIRMDPWTQTEQQARQLLEDILALPFHQEMRDHYI